VSADFGSPNIAGISIGLLNTHQLPVGTILHLDPGPDPQTVGSGSAPYVLRTVDGDFAPVAPEATISKIVSADFSIEADADVQQVATSLSINLKTAITNNTSLVAMNVQRKTLRDPLGLINNDSRAVDSVKVIAGAATRFVVVSAASAGDGVELRYTASTAVGGEANVLKLGKFKLNINYACSDVGRINAMAAGGRAPILFFYVPVRYDSTTNKVVVDNQPIDLTKFRMVATVLAN
jgi:hypothetical protein